MRLEAITLNTLPMAGPVDRLGLPLFQIRLAVAGLVSATIFLLSG